MNLYQLNDAIQQVQDASDEGASTDEVVAALESIEMDFKEKAQNVAYMIRNLTSNAEMIKAEECRLALRRKATENHAARLKEYLVENMRAAEIDSVDDGKLKASVVKPKPMLVVTKEDSIPVEYLSIKTSTAVDKKALLAALKELPEGETIPGAEIGESKPGLTIK